MAAQELQMQLETAQALAAAVETVMNPEASAELRLQAQKMCEDFKENSKIAVQYGFKLAEKENSAIVRHFGLQVIEHCIKYRWNDLNLSEEDKNTLKTKTMCLVNEGTQDILVEAQHIKDGVSRIFVELMKRVWPQLWSNLFTDFTVLCEKGPTQTELVLQTLLRFAEDVVRFQSLPAQRRKELMLALNSAMSSIFSFLLLLLERHRMIFLSQSGPDAERACKVCESVLDTLTGYVDWVITARISESNIQLLLCSLLTDPRLGLRASEVLLLIVGRKGRPSDRKPVMVLFEGDPMNTILKAANTATEHISESTNFIFLKRLCEILFEMGKTLCALWGSTEDTGQPPNFEMFLQALLAFTSHPSQSLRQMIYSLWVYFLRHPEISKDPIFHSVLPSLIRCGTVSLQKVGYPSQNNSVSCEYSRLEFDSDEEFNPVLSNLRVTVVETIRLTSLMFPTMTFTVASSWLLENISQPIDIGTCAGKNAETGICSQSSPSYISWDACSVFLESVMSKVFLSDAEKPSVRSGIDLLSKVLDYETQDPLILSQVLSCISSLFSFLVHTPEAVSRVIVKIFGAVVFNLPGQTKSKRSQAVKNVRVHACSILVKVCKNYPHLLLPEFNHLYSCVKQLDTEGDQLSQMEKTILIEALIIVSNHFNDFSKQSAFIEEIIEPVKQLWSSADFHKAFSLPECFISYVGLDQPAVEPSSADTCGINRSHILYCINTLLAVIKRSECPAEFSVAQKGGFIMSGGSGDVMRNPATSHVMPLMENLVTLIKTVLSLFKPECLSLRHADFLKAYDIMEHDRHSILGYPPDVVDRSDSLVCRQPLERMQNFITSVLDNTSHILGAACQHLGVEFLSMPGLAPAVRQNILAYLPTLPDFKIRSILRNFIKPLVQSSSKECYQSLVVPILADLCPFVLQRLTEKWQQIKVREELKSEDDEEDPESAEVLETQIVRNLTKDFLELFLIVLLGKGAAASTEVKEEQDMEDTGDTPSKTAGKQTSGQADTHTVGCWAGQVNKLSPLGMVVSTSQDLYPSIITCLLTGLSWPDSNTCTRCTILIPPIFNQVMTNQQLSAEAVQHVFVTVLASLQIHGNTESCRADLVTLATFFYENYRKQFPCLKEVLLQIPDVDKTLVEQLEDKLNSGFKTGVERKKKEHFKKIVSPLIGKDIGQRFKRSAQFSALPRLFLESHRIKYPRVDEADGETLGLCELFTPAAQE